MQKKYIFITGGIQEGIGKSLIAASVGLLLKARGKKVTLQKLDPCININTETMSPYLHGEVFMTKDGAEADLDLGHYERFTGESLTKTSNITIGEVYASVLKKERQSQYEGHTVRVIPHIIDEIKSNIYKIEKVHPDAEIIIVEVGGVVGNIENVSLLEAVREIGEELSRENTAYIHVTVPEAFNCINELQKGLGMELLNRGIKPDIIIYREKENLSYITAEEIADRYHVKLENVKRLKHIEDIYEIPFELEEEHVIQALYGKRGICNEPVQLKEWQRFVEQGKDTQKTIEVAVVGKYVASKEAYLSVHEALKHTGNKLGVKIDIRWINSENVDDMNVEDRLSGVVGVIVPGGFGERGVEGKIATIRYVRENNIPFLGICLGMQCTVIEYARNVIGLKDANSTELTSKTLNPIISSLLTDANKAVLQDQMRLGDLHCMIKEGTKTYQAYQQKIIKERHRHGYGVDYHYKQVLEENGLTIASTSVDNRFVEIVEITGHKHFIGAQFHPEYLSKPNSPHPLFISLIKSCTN